jgi:hypothetical protein
MSNLDILWSRSTAADLARQIVQDSVSKAETATTAKKRSAKKKQQQTSEDFGSKNSLTN